MLPVETAFKAYTGRDGKPLNNGYVYFGLPNQNPLTAPVTVYWDAAGTLPALQPLRTENGYIMRQGTPANVFYEGSYSELVQDSKNRQLYFARTSENFGIATVVQTFLTNLASTAGSTFVRTIQAGIGAISRTLQDEARDVVRVSQWGAIPGTAADMGPKIQAAHTYATLINAALEFAGGEYVIGPGTSFTIDPTKTRWVGQGATTLKWSAAPVSGVAVTVVSSEAMPYETVRRMVCVAIDDINIIGSDSFATKYTATGLRIGNGTNQTNCLTISQVTLSGWSNVLDYQNNTWWITMNCCRFMWGTISTPATSGNWGENYTLRDCKLLDGVVFYMNYGEWRLFAGSLDNSQLIVGNFADVVWFGPHIENPGASTIPAPYIDIQGSEASVQLVGAHLVTNTDGTTPVTVAPFKVAASNTANGLLLDGLQYTQNATNAYYSLVAGSGRVRVNGLKILSLANFHFQVLAESARGQLRNYGFEAGDMSGWAILTNASFGTSTATVGSVRVRPGSSGTKSAKLTVTKTTSNFGDITIGQTVAIEAGEMLMVRFAYSRDYTSVAAQFTTIITWLDADSVAIGAPVETGYIAAASGVNDNATFSNSSYNIFAPGGTLRARVQITLQSATGIGTANLYLDDVFVNVCS